MSKFSRDKGRRGEYEVRDILKGVTGVDWMRTPLSGGYHMSFPWDLMPKQRLDTDHILEGVGIEVKNTAKLSIPQWIEQCQDAEEDFYGFQKNKWHLYFKNKTKWYVVMPAEELKRILP